MECFAHPGHQAVALCRGCLRGVCRDCAIDLGAGFVCSESCRPQVERMMDLQEASVRNTALVRSHSWVPLVMGLVFLLTAGAFYGRYGQDPTVFMLGSIGTMFLIQAVLNRLRRQGRQR